MAMPSDNVCWSDLTPNDVVIAHKHYFEARNAVVCWSSQDAEQAQRHLRERAVRCEMSLDSWYRAHINSAVF